MHTSRKSQLLEDSKDKSQTACLVFPNGQVLWGTGFGYQGIQVAELCFNTAMTGYQEILTDLSYAGQIINFTFPHIGNTGTNQYDSESTKPAAIGMITRNMPTEPSHWQAKNNLDAWLEKNKIIGIGNVDTRKITRLVRSCGAQGVLIHHSKSEKPDITQLKNLAKGAVGLEGKELTRDVTSSNSYSWKQEKKLKFITQKNILKSTKKIKIAAIDFGAKTSIFKCLTNLNAKVEVVPAHSSFDQITSLNPDGIFLSNGPGDPLATFKLFGKLISKLLNDSDLPIFGICLGHQLLGLASGAATVKMAHGHHGANHPVLELQSGKVEITSMNHGFTLDQSTLPKHIIETHVSLFDGSNCGIEMPSRKAFSVQYHPEASPGPQDSYYLFEKFFKNIRSTTIKDYT